MDLQELKLKLTDKLTKSVLNSRILLDKMRLIDESSRETAAYTDPTYAPFYYYLGTMVKPKRVMEMGFRLGLLSSCFLKGCNTVEKFLAFQEQSNSFYSERLGRANVRDSYKKSMDIHVGLCTDDGFVSKLSANEWDLVIVNEEMTYDKHMTYLDLLWPHMALDGLIVMDYVVRHPPAGQSFRDFCKAKGRVPVELPTRYGVGIVQK
jgi:predicted O-methyltransferase YrrM